MRSTYNFYEDALNILKDYYKDRIISSDVMNDKFEDVLRVQINLGEIDYKINGFVHYPYYNAINNSIEVDSTNEHDVLTIYIRKERVEFYISGSLPDGNLKYLPEYEAAAKSCEAAGEIHLADKYYPDPIKCFETNFNSLEEIIEIINFISEVATNYKFKVYNKFRFQEIHVTDLFKNIYVQIPFISDKLMPFKKFNKDFHLHNIISDITALMLHPINEYHDSFDSYFHLKESDDEDYDLWVEYKSIFEKIENFKTLFKKLNSSNERKILQGDIGIKFNLTHTSFDSYTYKNRYDNLIGEEDYSIYIFFEVHENASYLALLDFLTSSVEGSKFIEDIKNQKSIESVEFIKGKHAQLQYALEDRVARIELKSRLEHSTSKKENFKVKNIMTKKRLKYISSFYNEQFKLLEIYENPLPFVIEKAYREYFRSNSDLEMVTSGLHLLNILLKTRLLFPLEEYSKTNEISSVLNDNIKNELYKKKPSDGTFSKLLSLLNKELKENNYELSCFKKFNTVLGSREVNNIFNEIVAIRNRFAHPPYDAKAFTNTLSHYIPDLIELYRNALSDVEFIIPVGFKTINGKLKMSAKKLMGFESKFETVQIDISKDEVLNFETEQLVAYNKKTKKTILLSKFSSLIIGAEPTYTIGLFDGFENGETIFR